MVYYFLFITLKTLSLAFWDILQYFKLWILLWCHGQVLCMLLKEWPGSFANLSVLEVSPSRMEIPLVGISLKMKKNKTEFWYLILFYRMKVINTNQSVNVPDGVEVTVKSRVVTVKGARGTLTKVRKVIYSWWFI